MAGIYIHIPFCRKACHYCNFHFSTGLSLKKEMTEALCREIILQQHYINEEVGTIYFGGGTPSLLDADELEKIMHHIHDNYNIAEGVEITLECNPDDVNVTKLSEWKKAGINRLSMGVQSFREEDLMWMNRAHNATQSLQAVLLAKDHGFHNLSIDLIYGIPGLSNEDWIKNIEIAFSLNIPHFSCYALTVETGTALQKMIELKKKKDVDAGSQSNHFEILIQKMKASGYEHYEISNFALPGFRSRHNSNYWQGVHYLGIGPSAHSFNGASRQWNISNNTMYIKSIKQNIIPFEAEHLLASQKLNEYLMTALRTSDGINLLRVTESWNQFVSEKILKDAEKYLKSGMLFKKKDVLVITDKGKHFADGIAADLFVNENEMR